MAVRIFFTGIVAAPGQVPSGILSVRSLAAKRRANPGLRLVAGSCCLDLRHAHRLRSRLGVLTIARRWPGPADLLSVIWKFQAKVAFVNELPIHSIVEMLCPLARCDVHVNDYYVKFRPVIQVGP